LFLLIEMVMEKKTRVPDWSGTRVWMGLIAGAVSGAIDT